MNLHSIKPCSLHAPQLGGELVDWINVQRPLQLGDLRGKVTVLCFFACSGINSLHTLPAIARVADHLSGQPLAFIGVHTPKYDYEKDPEVVREAMARLGVRFPVLVDSERRLWDEFGVSAWPTIVAIDPVGFVIGQASGEPDPQSLENLVLGLLQGQREKKVPLDPTPLAVQPAPAPQGSLAWPGKVLAAGGRLFVSDTGHHQIVELITRPDLRAREVRRFGNGEPGLIDAQADRAQFRSPQGLAYDPDAEALWVADAGNHTVRLIDLQSGSVRTLAGTGEVARRLPQGPLDALRVPLRSPWDLAWDKARGRLYVAMAGTHQIWALSPGDGRLELVAGDGREARADGDAHTGALAQPAGLALADDGRLFVVDAEDGCVRELDLDARSLGTIAGGDLYDFGDREGSGPQARFAHPQSVAIGGRYLYVADTYNHRIKEVEPASGLVRVLFGNGHAITRQIAREEALAFQPAAAGESVPLFCEPRGVSVAGGALYVADTNNHRVLSIELATGVVTLAAGG